MASALEIAVRFFFDHFTYNFGGEIYRQAHGGPIGARLTMCVARLVLQQWIDDFKDLLREAGIKEMLAKIYVDDNRTVMEKLRDGVRFSVEEKKFKFNEDWIEEDSKLNKNERSLNEILTAMNSINEDLKFTLEKEEDFDSKRLPTLSFEIWSEKDGIHHSYYEKSMRNQVLTEKRSAQSENSKFAILTNELNRRFLMMDKSIGINERVSKVDQFTQQMINSGYSWDQSREIVVSALKGVQKREKLEENT